MEAAGVRAMEAAGVRAVEATGPAPACPVTADDAREPTSDDDDAGVDAIEGAWQLDYCIDYMLDYCHAPG